MTGTAARPEPATGRRRWLMTALAVMAGATTGLGFAPFGYWPLALAGWAVLPALMLAADTRWRAAFLGWAFSAGFFAHTLAWIVEPFLVDPVRHGWMAPFALLFMAGGLALFWAAAFWAAHALGRTGPGRVLFLVPMLGLAEFSRAYLLTGFPWVAPAQALVDSPVLPVLAWTGPQGLGLLVLAAALGVGLVPFVNRRARLAALAPVAVLAILAGAATIARAPAPVTGHTVRLIQPNAAQHQKWDPELVPEFFRRHLDLTAAGPVPDLVVWSESAIAPVLDRAGLHFAAIADAARGAQVALGIRRYDRGRFFNALVRLDGRGDLAEVYDKHHLVPFGEYIPLGHLARRVGIRGLAAEDGGGYSAGPGPRLMDFGPLGLALPLICYEAVFPQDIARAPGRADFLLQVTNDAWFGNWSGPYQHLTQARMRAVEQGLPMLRAANTGISAVIDANGGIVAELGLGRTGALDATLPGPLPPTLYARTGDKPAFWAVLLLLAALLVSRRRRTPLSD